MFTHNKEKADFLIDGLSLSKALAGKNTPAYIYSENQLRSQAQKLLGAARKYFPTFRLQYAIKANSNPHVLKIFKDLGIGADCSSPYEYELAKKMGFDLKKSTYTGNYESIDDFKAVCFDGMTLNMDDGRRLDEVLKFAKPELISFRINPGVGRGSHEGIVTGGKNAKFGIPFEDTRKVYEEAIRRGIPRFGIHMMTGSNVLDAEYFAEITNRLFDLIEKFVCPLGIPLEFINIGGGLGIPYTDQEKELDLDLVFSSVKKVFDQRLPSLNIGNPDLCMEPGRYLVAQSGYLASRVTYVKESYRSYVGLDAGMSTLLRPAMYDAYHRVHLSSDQNTQEGKPYFICGQICENSDIFPEARLFTNPKVGDLAVIRDAGAYGFTMSSNYNHRPRPAEYMVTSSGEFRLIRREENFKDVFDSVVDLEQFI